MPIEPSLPIAIWQYSRWFPWPLVWEVSVDWSFSVEGELIEEGDGFTDTSTITGSGSGNVIIGLDPVRAPLNGGANVNEEKFIVTRRLNLDLENATKFQLFCGGSSEAGTFSITETLETDFDDPDEEDLIDPPIITEGTATFSLQLDIGPETVTVESLGGPSFLWIGPDSWTFSRENLFLPQTQTQTKTATEIGYGTGDGYEQTVTIQLTAYADRPL
jgi:hypothetical protein